MDDDRVPRHTVAQVAGQLKRPVQTIRNLVSEHNLGRLINPRMRLLSDADIEILKTVLHDGPGRPPKTSE
jgi:hypothetical protein